MNDDSADIVQRVKHLEQEVYVKQDAFNRDIHQEVEKIHEDRRGSSLSRTDQGVQQTNVNNAAQCCTVS